MSALQTLKSEYLNEAEVAEFLGISVKTLRNRICARKDHPPMLPGKKFAVADLKKWMKQREVSQFNKAS